MNGIIHIYAETGTEGGYWAFQDEKHIEKSISPIWPTRWLYSGLHTIETGDKLTIFSEDKKEILWSDVVSLKHERCSGAFDMHHTPTNVSVELWNKLFMKELPAELIKHQ